MILLLLTRIPQHKYTTRAFLRSKTVLFSEESLVNSSAWWIYEHFYEHFLFSQPLSWLNNEITETKFCWLLLKCVRFVWNNSLACCQEKYKLGKKKPTNYELQKHFIARALKTEDRVWLAVVPALATTAIFKRCFTRVIKTFLNQLKATEKVNL